MGAEAGLAKREQVLISRTTLDREFQALRAQLLEIGSHVTTAMQQLFIVKGKD